MDMKHFTFVTNEDISTLEVAFTGELKGVSDFQVDLFTRLEKKIAVDAESKIVYINLSNVSFWDTEGMRHTLVLAHDINTKIGDARVFIIAPRSGYLFNRAKEKYKDIVDKTVQWKLRPEEV